MNVGSMRLPAFRINDRHVWLIEASERLRRSTQETLAKLKQNTYFIDADCRKYAVIDVINRGRKWESYLPYPLGARLTVIKVEYVLDEPIQLSFDEVKQLIVELVVRKKWYRQGDQTEQEFRAMVAALKSMEELAAKISAYGEYVG